MFTDLFQPIPVLFPVNVIGEFATPVSLSLRLFGNIMAGTIMLSQEERVNRKKLSRAIKRIILFLGGFSYEYFK